MTKFINLYATPLILTLLTPNAYAVSYRITDLGGIGIAGLPEFEWSIAYGINDAGAVVGAYSWRTGPPFGTEPAGAGLGAFLWQNGLITDLGSLASTSPPVGPVASAAYAINNSSTIAGWSDVRAPSASAVRWEDGKIENLNQPPTPFDDYSYAMDINDKGEVTGYAYIRGTSGGDRGFLWKDGIIQQLGGFPQEMWNNRAVSINDSGEIAGYLASVEGNRAFRWKEGTATILSTPEGADSFAFGINDSGTIIGQVVFPSAAPHGAVWTYDTLELLAGSPTLSSLAPLAINDRGQIVGYGNVSENESNAFIWEESTGISNLNSMVDPADPLYGIFMLIDARAINSSGQIVGTGLLNGIPRAYLATPVPLPAGGYLLLSSLAILNLLRSNRRSRAVVWASTWFASSGRT
jgi:probable HAF family extracellular repeat protein